MGVVIGASKIARDIAQRKRTEEALRTSEKIASVGRLAATWRTRSTIRWKAW